MLQMPYFKNCPLNIPHITLLHLQQVIWVVCFFFFPLLVPSLMLVLRDPFKKKVLFCIYGKNKKAAHKLQNQVLEKQHLISQTGSGID